MLAGRRNPAHVQLPIPFPSYCPLFIPYNPPLCFNPLQVFVNKVDPTYALPWQKGPQRSSTGSAFVLDTARRQLLTNAHVVDNANVVYVRRPGIPKKFKATVVCVGKVRRGVHGRACNTVFFNTSMRKGL